MKTPPFAALATALLIGSASIAGPAANTGADVMSGITWTVMPAETRTDLPSIEFRYGGSNTTISLDRESLSAEVGSALATPGDRAFIIDREPGVLSCTGRIKSAHDGRGTCTFAPDRRFDQDLRARGLASEGRSDLLAMALLGGNRGLIDGLVAGGVAPASASDVIAAAALKVTPDYVATLKSAGLELNTIDDAIACRALDVEPSYVRALADAGYRLDADHVIAMKAVGVTPEYVRRLNLAAQN